MIYLSPPYKNKKYSRVACTWVNVTSDASMEELYQERGNLLAPMHRGYFRIPASMAHANLGLYKRVKTHRTFVKIRRELFKADSDNIPKRRGYK